MPLIDLIDRSRLPQHIAVIMDGNGRWARRQGEERIFGHRNAISAVRAATEGCAELDIPYLTLYAFSTENWSRPKYEVDALMELMVETIHREMKTLMENNIRLQTLGDLKGLPAKCARELEEAMMYSRHNTGLTLILAVNYSSQWELTQAMRRIAQRLSSGEIRPEDITAQTISNSLQTAGIPNPELMIRTSGEMRLSNFLLWQLAYAELYFTPVLWPDFSKEDLFEAILEFQKRERRFGMTSEQIRAL
ncbi:MAG: isoprenyl transferase [Chitinophagales bacterium]|nr:isoprenyl transferase [Chitinophagales bacterium]MDW8394197.1 isoprenyl transferase [Chitinophagales bacterium]